LDDQIKDEMGTACSTPEDMRNMYRMLVGNLKGKYHLEDLGIDGSIILK
jgi:hypothetical protein